MKIGKPIRTIREAKGITQTEIARRTGLLPSYVSRIEGDRTKPEIPMLDRVAAALRVQVYEFFFDGNGQPTELPLFKRVKQSEKDIEWPELEEFGKLLARMSDRNRAMLFGAAKHMAKRGTRPRSGNRVPPR